MHELQINPPAPPTSISTFDLDLQQKLHWFSERLYLVLWSNFIPCVSERLDSRQVIKSPIACNNLLELTLLSGFAKPLSIPFLIIENAFP